jgi:hypothetical protein
LSKGSRLVRQAHHERLVIGFYRGYFRREA